MSELLDSIAELTGRLLDLLVDAVYLVMWAVINWLLHYGLEHLHPSTLLVIFYWTAQGLFAVSTLLIVGLHLVKDASGSRADSREGEHGKLSEIWGKFLDMAKQFLALVTYSTLLVGWAFINWLLHLGMGLFESEASGVVDLSHWAAQIVFAIITLYKIVVSMYRELGTIYRRLFPKKVGAQ
jgi:hypothetical protein